MNKGGVSGFDMDWIYQLAISGFSLATIKTGKTISAEDYAYRMAA